MAENDAPILDSDRVLLGISAVLLAHLDARADGAGVKRSEFILSEAGFTQPEIAALTGRKREAVRSTLRRAQKAKNV